MKIINSNYYKITKLDYMSKLKLTKLSPIKDRPVYYYSLGDLINNVNEMYYDNFNINSLSKDKLEELYAYSLDYLQDNVNLYVVNNGYVLEPIKEKLEQYRQKN